VQRERVIACAGRLGMQVVVRDVELSELYAADAIFLTNSVFGLWPVARFEQRHWTDFSCISQLRAALAQEMDL
jgi:4-amino-4-deoxychorismate lyase